MFVKNNIQPLFLKYIQNKNSLTPKESEIVFLEIENIKKYVKKWILYEIKENYNKKNKVEQKLETLFYKLKKIYDQFIDKDFEPFFEENLEYIIEEAIFDSIGITAKKQKIFSPTNNYSNILYWIHSLVFYKTLEFLENELLKYESAKQSVKSDKQYKLEIETKLHEEDWKKLVNEIMSDSDLLLFIPPDIQEKLKLFLLALKIDDVKLSEEDKKNVAPYIETLMSVLKNKKEFYEEILFF